MPELNAILEVYIIMVKESCVILPKPSNGSAKLPNKGMLVHNIILVTSIIMAKESHVILPKP